MLLQDRYDLPEFTNKITHALKFILDFHFQAIIKNVHMLNLSLMKAK